MVHVRFPIPIRSDENWELNLDHFPGVVSEAEGHSNSCLKEIQPLLASKSRKSNFWNGVTSDIQVKSEGALSERNTASVIESKLGSKVRERTTPCGNQPNPGSCIRFHKRNSWLDPEIGMVDERVCVAIEKVCGVGDRMFSSDEAAMSQTRSEYSKSMRIKSLSQIGCTPRGGCKRELSWILCTSKDCEIQN